MSNRRSSPLDQRGRDVLRKLIDDVKRLQSQNSNPVALPPGYEIGYEEITANAVVTDTAEGTGTPLITAGPFVFDGDPVTAVFSSPLVRAPSTAGPAYLVVNLWDITGTPVNLGVIGVSIVLLGTNVNLGQAMMGSLRFSPSAGPHIFKIAAWVSSTDGTPFIGAGAGGSGTQVPAYLRFLKV